MVKDGRFPNSTGRHANATQLSAADQCLACQPGSSCSAGALIPTPCAAGTFSSISNESACTRCSGGTFQPADESTACLSCTHGSFCPEGASAALPCPRGRFAAASNLTDGNQCENCPRGHFCFAGATAPVACSPGSHAPDTSSSLCSACAEGTFQSASGSERCIDCGRGFVCAEGSSVRLPATCAPGTYLVASGGLSSAADCWPCPRGSACYGGSSAPRLCRPGTYAEFGGRANCTACEAGKYRPQGAANATQCLPCTLGNCEPSETRTHTPHDPHLVASPSDSSG